MKLSGSRIIIEVLKEQGVDTIFGYPGGAIMPFYDALYDAPIRHILTVHEQGAAHAADGYARASGRVGVCIATSGPGATNLVTGLATAFMDSVPVVAITGQVGTSLLGRDAFQEIDITGLTMPITKHNFLIRNIQDLAETLRKAFFIAREGRPGPVLIDVPRDILLVETDYWPERRCTDKVADTHQAVSPSTLSPQLEVSDAAEALEKSQRPILLVGGGVIRAKASTALHEFCKQFPLPIVSTLMGLGATKSDTPYYLGLTGMHGHRAANLAVASADLVLAVGSRFSDRVTGDRSQYVQGKKIIHLDIDAAEVGKNVLTDILLIGDLNVSLKNLTSAVRAKNASPQNEWLQQIGQWQRQHSTDYDDCSLKPDQIMRKLSCQTADQNVIWVTDVGQHQMWAAQHLTVRQPGNWITSGGLGTMGFGLPAAIGAQLSCPNKKVVLIAGDGGFKMTGLELFTAAIEKIPLVCVILNNSALGMVRQWQHLFFNQRYSATTLPDFDFVRFSESCGVRAVTIKTAAELAEGFQQALSSEEPSVLIVNIGQNCMVDPMVQPGQPLHQFVAMD